MTAGVRRRRVAVPAAKPVSEGAWSSDREWLIDYWVKGAQEIAKVFNTAPRALVGDEIPPALAILWRRANESTRLMILMTFRLGRDQKGRRRLLQSPTASELQGARRAMELLAVVRTLPLKGQRLTLDMARECQTALTYKRPAVTARSQRSGGAR